MTQEPHDKSLARSITASELTHTLGTLVRSVDATTAICASGTLLLLTFLVAQAMG